MERRTVGVARLRVVPEKADIRPGGRDQRRGTPESADTIPLEAGDDTARERAGPWGTASAQVLSGYRKFDSTRSERGYLWREGCRAQMQDEIYVGIEVECWCIRWMG